jgi:hypothetical protein
MHTKRSTPELGVGFVGMTLVIFYNELPEAKPQLLHDIISLCACI